MDLCECTSGQEWVAFEGPEGHRYALVINPGCSNCGYEPYVGITRYDVDPNGESCQGCFKGLPEIEFEGSWEDPTTLYIDIKAKDKIKKALLGQEIKPKDMDEEKVARIDEDCAKDLTINVVMPAIREAIRDTIHKTMERL